jgi:hypothetical protein
MRKLMRHIVRSAGMYVGVPVLLLVLYVGSYLAGRWFHLGLTNSVHAPLRWYEKSDLPGSLELQVTGGWCGLNGNISFAELYTAQAQNREGVRKVRETLRQINHQTEPTPAPAAPEP